MTGRELLDALPMAAAEVVAGTVVAANGRLADELAVPIDELVGRSLASLVPPADVVVVGDWLARAVASSVPPLAVTWRVGEVRRHVELRAGPFPGAAPGGPDDEVPLLVVVRDRRDEHRLSSIIDATADSTMLLDHAGLVSWQSERLGARLEQRRREAVQRATEPTATAPAAAGSAATDPVAGIGINPIERIHPEDLPTVLDRFTDAVLHPGRRLRFTVRSRSVELDDHWEHIEISGSSQLDHPDLQGILVQVRNLDAAEHIESLAETAGEMQSLTDAAPLGILVVDAWGRTVYQNGAARALLGVTDVDAWYERTRPDDAEALRAAVRRAIEGDEHTTITAAFTDAEGKPVTWVRVRTAPRYADGHLAVGAIATLEDVTAEVQARAQTERLTQMLDATSDYVAVFRPGGEILYVNEALEEVLARLRAEGAAGVLEDLIDDVPRERWIAAAVAALGEEGRVWRGELPLNLGGGLTVPVSALGVVHRGDDGGFDWIAMLARDISELRHLATHDVLTGLPNRSLFVEELEAAVDRHARSRRGVAVLFCDLDGFKAINDDHGHAAGDAVLVEVAQRLRTCTGSVDGAARVGGDEFVLVCEGLTDTDELGDLAEMIIARVTQPVVVGDGTEVKVGISVGIGVARSRQATVDPDQLLTQADTAMYRAKARGGNRYRIAALDD